MVRPPGFPGIYWCIALVVALALKLSAASADESTGVLPSDPHGGWPSIAYSEAGSDEPLLADEPFLAGPSPAPRFSARLGAVFLQRARPAPEYLIFNPVTGQKLLDPADLVFPFTGGVDAGLMWRGTVADVEFRYFGVEQSTAAIGPVFSPDGAGINVPDSDPTFDPLSAKMNGASSLQSFELNLRRNVTPRMSLLAGLRYVSFRDAMGMVAGDPTLTSVGSILFGTRNHLFGLQIGADGILWDNGRRFRIESAIKAGVFANGAYSSLRGYDDESGESFAFFNGRDNTAFVGDLNVIGVYQLNRWWAVRAGYQFLWLSGVATGSMQFHNFDIGLETNTSATVFYHGALVGLERSW